MARVEGGTAFECIGALIRRYPELYGEILNDRGMLLLKWMLIINKERASADDDLSDPVKDGDIIEFLPVVMGG
jgi:molybdopterin converting factor small subunit